MVEFPGAGKRPPVRATIRGYTYQSSVASLGGRFMLAVSEAVRRNAGVAAGDEVDIDLELDTQPREVDVPAYFAAALHADANARRTFDALNTSNRLRHVLAINDARTIETRRRRIEKTVAELREGPPRR